tara:strand:+ start:518 stop:700 length:183 start_codon:yes stop_codon:yes gene_type:complete
MQLKFNRTSSLKESIAKKLVKLLLVFFVLGLLIFLLEKVNFPSPNKNFKKDVTNEIIKLK